MALVPVTVYKFKAGAECYVPDDADGFIVWLHDPQGCFEAIERHAKAVGIYGLDFKSWWDSRCLKDNYCVMFGDVIADEFCGEPLDGVAWEVDQIGIQDSIWNGSSPDDYTDFWNERTREIQQYIDVAEKLVTDLLARRKEEEPRFWKMTYHTAWRYWESRDSYTGECDGGCEYVGVMDITHGLEVSNEL